MSDQKVLTAINQRVWYVEGGVHPTRSPLLLSMGKFSTDPSQAVGEDTKITAPDPNSFQRDIQVGTVKGSVDRATLSVAVHYTTQKAILLDLVKKGCRVDVFALSGTCGNPQDFTEGGEKWTYFPDGRIGNHSFENFGSYGLDENNPTNEIVDINSAEYWEFLYMKQEPIGTSVTVREIYTVDVYTGNDCEACPDPCDRILASMAGTAATPGTVPTILYSPDGGETWSSQNISTMFSNEDISDGEIIAGDIVYVSNIANELHWTDIEALYDQVNVWNQTATGFVKNKGARAIYSADARHSWVVGDGGYVYFVKNHKVQVDVQDAGVATSQNLLAVHGVDENNVISVGNSNAVIYTNNGGISWIAATGPAVGINLGACWMWDKSTWFVGEGANGQGRLWLTTNAGRTWSQINLPGTYLRIDKIRFVSDAEGYISARTGGTGVILRTITAGNEWVTLPQGKRAVVNENSYLRDIGVCSRYSNTIFAAGLADNGTAGTILRMTN